MAGNVKAADVVKLFQKAYDEKWGYIWGASGQIHTQAAQDQAPDRAHRIGQMAHVQVYKLIAKDTIEEKNLELQEQKRALLDTVSGGEEGSIIHMTSEKLQKLQELLKI